eukprot:2113644-Rhodomonas_salina.1
MTGNPSPSQIFENSILSSPKWKGVKQTIFKDLVRQANDPEYCSFVQRLGDGVEHSTVYETRSDLHLERLHELYGDDIPENRLDVMHTTDIVDFPHHSLGNDDVEFIRQVFPDINDTEQSLSERRSILASTNQQKDEWNSKVQALRNVSMIDLPAEHVVKCSDSSNDDMTEYHNVKFPDSLLQLKIGDVLLVTATVTVETGGICNNSQ